MGGYALYRASLPVLERIRRTEPVQLVHAHMIDRDGHCGYLLSRKTGLPYVVTGHGTDVLRYFVPGQTPHRRNIRTVQKADALCAVSSMLMKRVAPYRPDGISRIVPNGVDLSLVPENEKRIPFSILSVGTLKARKCMDKTLEAFSGLAQEFPQYGWDKNMGYPSAAHREAIAQYGTTPHHRLSFRLLPERQLSLF
jgi:glycosyltransferase involved in cell wall biosynthesis